MTDYESLVGVARARYKLACDEMDRLTNGSPGANWRWSIPANPARDSDLILSASAEDVPKLADAVEALTAKLDMPCGSCHPCTQWANQTWVNAGLPLPHVLDWQEMVAERDALRAQLATVRAEALREAADRIERFFPDPHTEDEGCDDCDACRALAAELRTFAMEGGL